MRHSRGLSRTSTLRKMETKSCSAIFTYWALLPHSESLVSVLGIWVRKTPIYRFRYIILSVSVTCVWRIANAKSRVDVGDRLRDCKTENIHTRNTLVIAFSYVAVGLWYTVFFHFIYSNTATCLATNLWRIMRESIIVRDSFGNCGLWTCVLTISEVNFIVAIYRPLNCLFLSSFLYFVVRVRCRGKKFTFAISFADELLVLWCEPTTH